MGIDYAKPWWRPALLILVCACCYANSLEGSFHYDDFHSIVDNPGVRDLDQVGRFFHDTTYFSGDHEKRMFRPLLLVTFALNYAAGEYSVLGYHLVNIFLHAVCVVLVWALSLRLRMGEDRALICALLFAVHPLASEPANYISSRSELLMACFFLSACVAHLYHSESKLWQWYAAALLAAALTLLSKSVGLVLVGALIFCDWHSHGRAAVRQRWLYYLPYAALNVGYILFSRELIDRALNTPVRPLTTQVWTQIKALTYYLKLLVMPWGLNVEHQFFESAQATGVTVASLLLVLSICLLIWVHRRRPVVVGVFFGLAWSGLILLPTFVTPLNMLVNERRLYLVIAGLIWAVISLVPEPARGLERVRGFARARGSLFVLLVVVLGTLTFERNKVWATELTLWQDALAKAPGMYRVQTNLGKAQHLDGDTDAAQVSYEKALAIDARHGDAYNNIATILHQEGKRLRSQGDGVRAERKLEEAISFYGQAIERYPTYEEIYQNLADAYAELGRLDLAVANYEKALSIDPRNGGIWNNYGQTLSVAGRGKEAESAFREAARLLPRQAEPLNNLANFFHARGQLEEAVAHYRRALELEPGERTEVLHNLADTYYAMDRLAEARTVLDEALGLDPKNASLHLLKGRVERQAGNREAAVWALARVQTLEPTRHRAFAELGEVYADAGEHDRAVVQFRGGLQVNPAYHRAMYGLARSLEALGESGPALEAYRRFTASWPHRDRRQELSLRRIQVLEQRQAPGKTE